MDREALKLLPLVKLFFFLSSIGEMYYLVFQYFFPVPIQHFFQFWENVLLLPYIVLTLFPYFMLTLILFKVTLIPSVQCDRDLPLFFKRRPLLHIGLAYLALNALHAG